jgi:hypothetical protein
MLLPELWRLIFGHLDNVSFVNCRECCKTWKGYILEKEIKDRILKRSIETTLVNHVSIFQFGNIFNLHIPTLTIKKDIWKKYSTFKFSTVLKASQRPSSNHIYMIPGYTHPGYTHTKPYLYCLKIDTEGHICIVNSQKKRHIRSDFILPSFEVNFLCNQFQQDVINTICETSS